MANFNTNDSIKIDDIEFILNDSEAFDSMLQYVKEPLREKLEEVLKDLKKYKKDIENRGES